MHNFYVFCPWVSSYPQNDTGCILLPHPLYITFCHSHQRIIWLPVPCNAALHSKNRMTNWLLFLKTNNAWPILLFCDVGSNLELNLHWQQSPTLGFMDSFWDQHIGFHTYTIIHFRGTNQNWMFLSMWAWRIFDWRYVKTNNLWKQWLYCNESIIAMIILQWVFHILNVIFNLPKLWLHQNPLRFCLR